MTMRILRLFVLLFALPLAAQVPTGRDFFVIDGGWLPMHGGFVTVPAVGQVDGAFDGERFLLGWQAPGGLRAGLFEEGALTPSTDVLIAAGVGKFFIRWDGTRHLVFWRDSRLHCTIVNAQGVVLQTIDLGDHDPADVAVAPGGVAIVETSTIAFDQVIDVTTFDEQLREVRRTRVASALITAFPRVDPFYPRIVPFAGGWYVTAMIVQDRDWSALIGAALTASGEPIDYVPWVHREKTYVGRVLFEEYSGLRPNGGRSVAHFGDRLVVMSRWYLSGSVMTIVEPDHRWRWTRIGTLGGTLAQRLDGTVVSIHPRWGEGGYGVADFLKPSPALPRRRSSRH